MIKCPSCDGSGKVGPVHFNAGEGPHEFLESIGCLTCGGSGEITEGRMSFIIFGAAARNERIARCEMLHEAAARLGIKPSHLSALESGRLPK